MQVPGTTSFIRMASAQAEADKPGRWRALMGRVLPRTNGRDRSESLERYEEQDRLYSAVVESATDAVVTKTLDGIITGWNPAAEAIFGYSRAEAIGRPIDLIVPQNRRDEVKTILISIGNGEHIKHYETVRRTKAGRLIDVSLSVSPVKSRTGEIIGAAKIARDISAEKLNERKFRAAVESAPNGLIMADRDGRITLTNPEAERQFGYDRGELLGLSLAHLVPERMRARHAAGYTRFFAAPAAHKLDEDRGLCGLRRDASEFPVEISVTPIESRDGMLVMATIVDITTRKQAEEAVARQAQRLRQSNAELEQFAYIASHDLQEPLRMVSSFTQLLAERYKGQLDEKADRYIEYVVEGAGRMQFLIRDLLNYSRLSSVERPMHAVDTATVVDAALDRLMTVIERSRADIDVGAMPVVTADEVELSQVFQNLIGNAIKFRSQAPVAIRVGANRTGDDWTFFVADNGIGISPDHADRLFKMFQRVHTRHEYDGSGIGLALAKKIVERRGGKIWFESEPGKGATFYFTVPANQE